MTETTAQAPTFTITRTFAAPRDLVWRAWTEKERLAVWMSPAGMEQIGSSLDLRPGGVFHYGLKSPDGLELWGRWVFREINPPSRLVFVQSFADAAGGLGQHPLAPVWPQETLSVIEFTEQNSTTTLHMTATPIQASAEELQVFRAAMDGMNQGWGGTFIQLDAYLAADRLAR